MASKYRTFTPPLSDAEIEQIDNKTSLGLTREQAEQVIQEQRDWNDHKDNPANKKKKADEAAPEDQPSPAGKKGKGKAAAESKEAEGKTVSDSKEAEGKTASSADGK